MMVFQFFRPRTPTHPQLGLNFNVVRRHLATRQATAAAESTNPLGASMDSSRPCPRHKDPKDPRDPRMNLGGQRWPKVAKVAWQTVKHLFKFEAFRVRRKSSEKKKKNQNEMIDKLAHQLWMHLPNPTTYRCLEKPLPCPLPRAKLGP